MTAWELAVIVVAVAAVIAAVVWALWRYRTVVELPSRLQHSRAAQHQPQAVTPIRPQISAAPARRALPGPVKETDR